MSLDLDEIEQRANAATPGPWRIVRDQTDGFYGEEAYDIHAGDGSTVAQGGTLEDGGPSVGACYHEDAEFIAHAREDIPALIAEVKRLRHIAEFAISQVLSR